VDAAAFVQAVQRHAAEVLVPMMRATAADADIDFERMAVAPAMQALETDRITRLVRELTGDSGERKVSYGTEAGMFQAAGVPSIVFGPGDIRQAHRADEFVELAQIRRCEDFLMSLIGTLASAKSLA
jgi:acetylornithine deacetylase